MVKTLQTISNVITKIMKALMILFVAYMVFAIGAEVIARYLFKHSFFWANESARYIMIWMIFLGAAEIVFNNEHVKVTVIEDMLKGIGKSILNFVQDIIGLIMAGITCYSGFFLMKLGAKGVSANMGISMQIVYVIFPVAGALLVLGYVCRILIRIASGFGKKGGNDA